ncbi:MAG: CheR family methyltransferase [Actinomycetota bacterium]|nr:CheR family methyltransferase [Actinomycetota bacterium]
MGLNRIDSIEEYHKYLINNPEEAIAASQDFLINVTSFFRDEPAYSALKEHLKERIMLKKPDYSDIRAWIPGCSTGEEAYSTAIIMHEAMEELKKTFKLQIFCTDIDKEAIEVARRGSYAPNVIKDISTKRLEKYFKKSESGQHTIK